jgi:hypothetical protein
MRPLRIQPRPALIHSCDTQVGARRALEFCVLAKNSRLDELLEVHADAEEVERVKRRCARPLLAPDPGAVAPRVFAALGSGTSADL